MNMCIQFMRCAWHKIALFLYGDLTRFELVDFYILRYGTGYVAFIAGTRLKLCPIGISSLRLENASLTLFGERVTPAVQRYHVDPDGQADGQSLWLLQ